MRKPFGGLFGPVSAEFPNSQLHNFAQKHTQVPLLMNCGCAKGHLYRTDSSQGNWKRLKKIADFLACFGHIIAMFLNLQATIFS